MAGAAITAAILLQCVVLICQDSQFFFCSFIPIRSAGCSSPPGAGPGRGGEWRQQEKDEEEAAGRRAGQGADGRRGGGAATGAAGGSGKAAARQGWPPGAVAGWLHGS